QLVRPETGLVARLAAFFSRAVDSLGAGRISADLLLLSRRILQGVLGRSALLHRERTAQIVSRREFLSTPLAKHPPILPLSGSDVHRFSGPRCLAGALVSCPGRRQCQRRRKVWNGCRNAGAGRQCDSARRIHVRLSFTASPGGWRNRPTLRSAALPQGLSLRELFESSPSALGV